MGLRSVHPYWVLYDAILHPEDLTHLQDQVHLLKIRFAFSRFQARQKKYITMKQGENNTEKQVLRIDYQRFGSEHDLPSEDRLLLQSAKAHVGNAYAPYSGFEVAAAVQLANNQIVLGSNQENASYGLCICAEQNALSTAGSIHGLTPIRAIAITARAKAKPIVHPISPCGACRQVISEHEDRHSQPIRVILQGESGDILVFQSVKDLLPFSFSGSELPT